MDFSRFTDPALLLSGLTFITLIATWVRTSMVERRNRRWAEQDRLRLVAERLEAKQGRARIAKELTDTRERIAAEMKRGHDKLAADLQETERAKVLAIEQVAREQREMAAVTQKKIDENTDLTRALLVVSPEKTDAA